MSIINFKYNIYKIKIPYYDENENNIFKPRNNLRAMLAGTHDGFRDNPVISWRHGVFRVSRSVFRAWRPGCCRSPKGGPINDKPER